MKIYKCNEVEMERIVLSQPDTRTGAGLIYIQYDEEGRRRPLIVEMPEIYVAEDMRAIESRYVTHELILPLKGKKRRETERMRSFFNELDEKMIEEGKKNLKTWPFKKKEVRYKMLVRTAEEYKNGIIKVKLVKSKNFRTRVFDEEKKLLKEQEYEKKVRAGDYVRMILEIVSIWIQGGVFGIYMRPHQLKLKPTAVKSKILQTDEDDIEIEQEDEENIIEEEDRMMLIGQPIV